MDTLYAHLASEIRHINALSAERVERFHDRFVAMDEAVRIAKNEAETAKQLAREEADKSKGTINIAAALAFIALVLAIWEKLPR